MNGTYKRIRIKITCPTCKERFETKAEPFERKVRCPECEGIIRIPPYNAVEEEFLRRLNEPRDIEVGTYGVLRDDAPPPPEKETITLICPICSTPLHPEVGDEPGKETCPDCLEEVRVPARSELPKKFAPLPIPDPGQYDMGTAADRAEVNTEVFERISHIKERTQDPPPKWTFFSSVFGYPWSRYVWPRWIYMSIGWTMVWALGLLTISMLLAGGVMGIAAAFFALPTVWLFYMTAAYSASMSMTVLEETANGTQLIDEWPEPIWKEWMISLLYFGFLGMLAQAVGYGVELVMGGGVQSWYVATGLIYALYPVLVLSSGETASVFQPVSGPVLASIASHTRYWILYYLLSAGLTAGLVAAAAVIVPFGPASAFAGGPLIAVYLLVQARLLGRLAWRTIIEPDGGKKRMRRAAKVKQMLAEREIERQQRMRRQGR